MVLVDMAGGDTGGSGRWRAEFDGYLAEESSPVRVIGRDRRLTARWLIERERLAAGADVVIAANNASFVIRGDERRVLSRNALHFLYPDEEHLLRGMSPAWRAQVPIVRRLMARADVVIASTTAMAERVAYHLPRLRARLTVRLEPLTVSGTRTAGDEPFILVPVAPAPYKNLFGQLRALVEAADRIGHPASVRVTARAAQLPPDLRARERIRPIGSVDHRALAEHWRRATAVFFPGVLESFGYPMAEARAYGLPVIAPDRPQSREVAGPALRGYRLGDPASLAEALERTADPVSPDPAPFDRRAYFRWLLGDLGAASPAVPGGGPTSDRATAPAQPADTGGGVGRSRRHPHGVHR